ncbi:asparagine synthase (glutamine-hydrolyzing) [Eubacterium sp. MSJ-13]|uniref:asparagine synthase (glutamine-hydrolyzing) n=1 Tax=Eubacterium sp. MSJ-13 TaxID=2841513 RepID=UPI001C122F78|nr:asparagine synthase (glutamine-hydrolyzing) [Eubacterium sp. MSJ-13]MBU5477605.1 asparagine synthase (glutamine-hydrolyzing) [Eubacterium sp. MSJ-13]
MCGILGGNDFSLNYNSGIRKVEHRGPDGIKVDKYNDFILAFARLSIIDLSEKAMQPMDSEDKSIHIVFNGEIYGFKNLRQKLEKEYNFRTTSDTEVILALYKKYGTSFIDKIDGMFAIAIYDENDRKVRIYRDRAGIKPLYYYFKDGIFIFASELKSITEVFKDRKLRIDETALYDYVSYGYIPEPKSMYKDIKKLLPACFLEFDLCERRIVKIKKYWKLHVNTSVQRRRTLECLTEEFRYLVGKSVREQLVADVPVGTFLSGGIDSSIITYESAKIKKDIQTFSIGFEEKNYSEIKWAEMLINKLDLNADVRILTRESVKNLYKKFRNWYDEPYADTSAFPSYIVSKIATDKVSVVLTGDGGDELFGGYSRYNEFDKNSTNSIFNRENVSKIVKLLLANGLISSETWEKDLRSEFDYYAGLMGCKPDCERELTKKMFNIPKDYDEYWLIKKYYKPELPKYTRARYLDFKTYLPGDILTKVDRVSMAVSLETRVPFLSRELMEFAFSLSQEECNTNGNLKQLLKDAYTNVLPDEILYRRKKGFSVPPKYVPGLTVGLEGVRKKLLEDLWKSEYKEVIA